MTRFSSYILIAFTALSIGACDSNDGDENSAVDQFVGEWVLAGAEDDKGDQFEKVSESFSEIRMILRSSKSASVIGTAVSGGDDVQVDGVYSVSESSETLTLVTTISGIGEVALPLVYDFESGDSVDLTANEFVTAALNAILDTDLVGSVVMSFDRQ